ncbi:predicted protein [Postia placenta Mad-698-R]|uniref:UPF3 domain-containing protein n=1 Tax=Postia placenta MAD-698-R-SB12 TaxID=670580 RepID=A0A1X6MPI5_9APHY|nr:hypothetical protein POSPLADRAFT_1036375 [Postia placenta MAD-698-R-SB12]EED84142.1 predicted protein [Postia placenta Mad-698-R]OSX58278.1 hypothetical protein POSPLADRAFT_1036375 [Postia placenta MAD-698-R-SB12]
MSPSETAKPISSPNAKAKTKEKEKRARAASKQQTERLKTVVRRLPPNLPENIFWQSVEPWVREDTVTWKAYYLGKSKKRLNKENISSRAYIAFKNEDVLATFSKEYDGHVFRDKAGNESIAVVEFAPYQKVPSDKKKVDTRMGTIEKDEEYISFLESLKEGSNKPVDGESLDILIIPSAVAASQPPPQPTTTPLLEALKAEKSAQKDKEAILRNHAHYKDQAAIAGPSIVVKKEDGKKKSAALASQKPSDSQPSKKAAKKAAKNAAQQQTAPAAAPSKPPQSKQAQAQPAQAVIPKAPRQPRERHPKPSIAQPAPTPSSSAPSGDAAPSSISIASAASTSTQDSAQPAPTRRARPMLGPASRQFEAALSGAGVERKARRERDRQTATDVGPAGAVGLGDGAGRGEEKRGSGASRATPAGQNQATPTAPMILQREGQQIKVGGGPPAVASDVDDGAAGGRSGGKPRSRGRGRGAQRGGAP